MTFGALASLYGIVLRSGQDELEARALAFTALIVANLGLILANRSWSRSIVAMVGVRNPALWWVIGGASAFLALTLSVPAARAVFRSRRCTWTISRSVSSRGWPPCSCSRPSRRHGALRTADRQDPPRSALVGEVPRGDDAARSSTTWPTPEPAGLLSDTLRSFRRRGRRSGASSGRRRATASPAPAGASIRWRRSFRPAGGTPRT